MTTSNKTSVSRKLAMTLGAIVVSTMTLAGAAEAKPKFHIDLYFGGAPYYGSPFVGSYWGGNPCWFYKHKWDITGKFKWKKKYFKCMGWW